MKGQCIILEGSWWRAHEQPQVLPFMTALSSTNGGFDVSHRTIRCADDLRYWIQKVPKGARAFVYVACHGENLELLPVVEQRVRITRRELIDALGRAKPGAVAFLHFGCCEMVDASNRRESLEALREACDAHWVSGYTRSVDWLRSTMLDLALVAEVYLGFAASGRRRGPKLQSVARRFIDDYEQLARALGFSGLSRMTATGKPRLFPKGLSRTT